MADPAGCLTRRCRREGSAAGLAGSALLLVVWGAGRGGDHPGPPEVVDPASTTTTTSMPPGRVHVVLVDDDEETDDLTWDIDLATATASASSALCGPSGSFHLAVVDRKATPLRGLRLSTVSPWTGPGQAPVSGQLLPADGPDTDVTGTITTRVDGDSVEGDLELRGNDGTTWTGSFSCGP